MQPDLASRPASRRRPARSRPPPSGRCRSRLHLRLRASPRFLEGVIGAAGKTRSRWRSASGGTGADSPPFGTYGAGRHAGHLDRARGPRSESWTVPVASFCGAPFRSGAGLPDVGATIRSPPLGVVATGLLPVVLLPVRYQLGCVKGDLGGGRGPARCGDNRGRNRVAERDWRDLTRLDADPDLIGATGFEPATFRPPVDTKPPSMRSAASHASLLPPSVKCSPHSTAHPLGE